MEETPERVAHSLIASHGPAALDLAERAARNVLQVGMQDKAEEWTRVVVAVKKMLGNGIGAHSDYEKRANEVRREVDEAIELSAARLAQSTKRLQSSHEVLKRGVDAMARSLVLLASRDRGAPE